MTQPVQTAPACPCGPEQGAQTASEDQTDGLSPLPSETRKAHVACCCCSLVLFLLSMRTPRKHADIITGHLRGLLGACTDYVLTNPLAGAPGRLPPKNLAAAITLCEQW